MDKSKEKEEQSIMDKSMRSVFGKLESFSKMTPKPSNSLLINC